MTRRIFIASVAGAAVAVGIATFVAVSRRPAPADRPSLTQAVVAINQAPHTLDPIRILDAGSLAVGTACNSPLALLDEHGEMRMCLAESITIDAAGRTCEIRLRSGLRFRDGSGLTARDVADSIRRLRAGGAPHSWVLDAIKGVDAFDQSADKSVAIDGVKVIDDLTVRLELAQPDPDLPRFLAGSVLMITKSGSDAEPSSPYDANIVGVGPFRPVSLTDPNELVFERDPNARVPPSIERLAFKIIESPNAQLQQLRNGSAQVVRLRGSMRSELAAMGGAPGVEVHSFSANELVTLVVNRKGSKAWTLEQAVDSRRAVEGAIDRVVLARALYADDAQPVWSVVPPAGGGEVRTEMPNAALPGPNTAGSSFELLAANDQESRRIAAYVQQRCQTKGLKIDVIYLDLNQLISRVVKGDYQVSLLWVEQQSTTPIGWLTPFFSKRGKLTMIGEPILDPEAIKKARATLDPTARCAAYAALARIVDERQQAWVPLMSRRSVYAIDSRLKETLVDQNGTFFPAQP